jgi:hypothetical protein
MKENSLMREEWDLIYSDFQFFICVKVAKFALKVEESHNF